MSKTQITELAGYAQIILETASKPSDTFNYFHFLMKQILRQENIKNGTLSVGSLY